MRWTTSRSLPNSSLNSTRFFSIRAVRCITFKIRSDRGRRVGPRRLVERCDVWLRLVECLEQRLALDAVGWYDVSDLTADELKSDQEWGQTFEIPTSAGSEVTVSSVSAYLYRHGQGGKQVTASIRATWDGAELWSSTVQASAIENDSDADQSSIHEVVNFTGDTAQLNTGQTYYLRLDTTANEKIYVHYDEVGGYSDGDYIDKDGEVAGSGKDMLFSVSYSTDVNVAPSASNGQTTINEDSDYVFTNDNFGFSDTDGDSFTNLLIKSLPSAGVLALNGTSVSVDQVIPADQRENLRFSPAQHGNGDPYATFSFQVQDDGGTAHGGDDTSDTFTRTITVNAVNDAPAVTGDLNASFLENGSVILTSDDLGFSDVDDSASEVTFDVVGLNDAAISEVTIEVNGLESGSFTGAQLANGLIEFSHDSDVDNPPAEYTFRVRVEDGNEDNSPAPASTLTVSVVPINDAPTATDTTTTIDEDVDYVFSDDSFGFNDVDGDSLANVIIKSLPSAGSLTLGDSPVSANQAISAEQFANLRFTPVENANGESYSLFTFQVQDDGGTANGGDDTSANYTRFITVNAVNDAPVLETDASPTLGRLPEDPGTPSGVVGTLVSSLIDSGGALDNYSDIDGDLPGIAIIGTQSNGGTVWYSIDGGSTWADVGAVSATAARVLHADDSTRLYYQPGPDFNGSVTSGVTIKAWDRTGGLPNGDSGVDTTSAKGFSAAIDTVSVNVRDELHVTDVIVTNTNWGASFIDAIDDGSVQSGGTGLSVFALGANQERAIPWDSGIDRIDVHFSEDVASSFDASDLALIGGLAEYSPSYSFDETGTRLSLVLSAAVTRERFALSLNSNGIVDEFGRKLDGEWATGNARSGDGNSGGQFNFRFNVLAGDSSGDGYVLINDLVPIYTQLGTAPDSTEQFLDSNGDGLLSGIDLGLIYPRLGQGLPAPPSFHDFAE